MHVSDWEEILQEYRLYKDEGPLLQTRKNIVLLYASLSLLCQQLILSKVFIYLMLITVSTNMVVFSYQIYGDNYSKNPEEYDQITSSNQQP
jgi:hypothetical protein